MFCWPSITVYQYNETNVMQFSFDLWRIKGLYMFRALIAHPQEVAALQPCHSQLTLYARNIPNAVCVAPPDDEQVKLETCRGLWFSINCMKIASLWFHYTDVKSSCLHNRHVIHTAIFVKFVEPANSKCFCKKAHFQTLSSAKCGSQQPKYSNPLPNTIFLNAVLAIREWK
jgi:hypothetical protein